MPTSADVIGYTTETRIDGQGQPYQVRIPQYKPEKPVSSVVAKTPNEIAAERYSGDGGQGSGAVNADGSPKVIRYTNPQDKTRADYFNNLDIAPVDDNAEAKIRKDIADRMQAQLDAIDVETANLTAAETAAGAERLKLGTGKTRATSSRAGLFSSPMGDANMANEVKGQTDFTQKNLKIIQDQQNLKKQAVLDKIDSRAQETINAKKLEVAGNFKAWTEYQDKVRATALQDAKDLAGTGISLLQLKNNKEYYDQLISESGQPEFVFDQTYNNAVSERNKIKYEYTWKGNNLVATGVDPQTGKMVAHTYDAKELGIPSTVDPAFQTNENTGQMYWYDKNNPEVKDGKLVLTPIGQFKKPVTNTPKAPNIYALPTKQQIVIKGIQEQIDAGTLTYGDAATKYEDAAPYLNPRKGATLSPFEQAIIDKLNQ